MYTTCLFCSGVLGTNEVIEQFPVGRRLAFDPEKGRLWVVCRRCQRWNLTPLEERWEAIEQAERLYRDTRLRVSTEQIGLARLSEGLELVRIGRPQRPEIAAWRYGDQFGRRRRRQLLGAGAVVTAGGIALAGGLAAGLGVAVSYQLGRLLLSLAKRGNPIVIIGRVRDDGGKLVNVKRRHLLKSTLGMGADGGLAVNVAHTHGVVHLEGSEARRALATLLPTVNQLGGTNDEVQLAVGRLERAGTAERFLLDQARRGARLTPVVAPEDWRQFSDWEGAAWESGLYALSPQLGLALEMALNEEQERRLLEGELAELEAAWREAEEIGAIADSLFLPEAVERAFARLKGRGTTPE